MSTTSRKGSDRRYDQLRADDPHWQFLRSREWKTIRRLHLRQHPLCEHCKLSGRTKLAAEVDHVVHPHGDAKLSRDPANLQSLCRPHHNRKTAGRALTGSAADGRPIDPQHPWNTDNR